MSTLSLLVCFIVAWSLVCVQLGRIVQTYWDRRDDLNARDKWAATYEGGE